mgnify:FL=1
MTRQGSIEAFPKSFGAKVNFYQQTKFEKGLLLNGDAQVKEIFEKVCLYDTYSSESEIEIDIKNGSLHYYINEATGNFTFNIKSDMLVEKSVVVTVLVNMGSSAYVMSNPTTTGFKINNNNVVVKWINSTAPTSGVTNAVNAYTFAIIKTTDTPDYTVLGTLSTFG